VRVKKPKCECFICKDQKPFQFDKTLVNEFMNGRVVIFAGAGVSTESPKVLNCSLYESVADDLGLSDCRLSFSELMERCDKQPNGRIELLKKVKQRFGVIESFPELFRFATRFHAELATFYPINTIITTNWDTFFEDVCGAVPFVTDEDIAFWNIEDRKVLKLHGSINNYGSIVATTADYKKRARSLSTGLVGTVLKSILATQTVVFVGYSFSDFDIQYIFNFVRKQLKGLKRQSYVVTTSAEEGDRFKRDGLIPIVTDGTYFIGQLKKHAVHSGALLSDDIYDDAEGLRFVVNIAHNEMHEEYSFIDYPQLIYASAYQDGMMHALERMLNLRKTGEYNNEWRTRRIIDIYMGIRKEKLGCRAYEDVAYVDGYINSLLFTLLDKRTRKTARVPLYFAFGIDKDLLTLRDFAGVLPNLPQKHKASFKRALEYSKTQEGSSGPIFHHPVWL